MENKNTTLSRLTNYETFGRSILWTFPERIDYTDATQCQSIFDEILSKICEEQNTLLFVFDFAYTEHVYSSMIGFLIIMRKKLLASGIEPVFIFSKYMEKITKILYCYELFMDDNEN